MLVNDLQLSVALLAPAMFFCAFPISTSAAAMQVLTPSPLRAQVSALFLLVSNLIGLGIGTSLVALLTDHYFQDPKAVGASVGVVVAVAGLLCVWLLGRGRLHFRQSLHAERKATRPDGGPLPQAQAAALN
ncbi:hypothetical protein D9M68_602160 [compost metagenome]